MKISFRSSPSKQVAASGTANLLIKGIFPFNGKVDEFITDGKEVFVGAFQELDTVRSRSLSCLFSADIQNGKHEYVRGGAIKEFAFFEYEKVEDGTRITPFFAVYDSGHLDVTFNFDEGTFSADVDLQVQNNATEPVLEAVGGFKDVSGLSPV